MRIGQFVSLSDTGRRRRNNEDVYVSRPPLFAIADGMGGAQAGEVAAGLAAEALEEHAGDEPSEERVAAVIQEANRRVYERASRNPALSGMGTTLTVAAVGEGKVSFGHVGDSRAYLLRGGRLQQVTDDHSLVAELTRAGKLSEEEAETHPQRSVITRALGTDPDVDVDVFTLDAEDGDVFLLCSDGLTDMLDDGTIEETLQRQRSNLKKAAQALVKAANRRGGEDNITVLLFEMTGAAEETLEAVPAAPAEGEQEADEDTLSEIDGVPVVRPEEPDGWAVDGDRRAPAPAPARRRRRRSRRALYWGAAALVVLVVAGLSVFGLSQAHFVGAERDGHVAVFEGVPYDVAGIHLYRSVYVSPVVAAQLTQPERQRLFDHTLRSYDSARAAIGRYEQEIEP